MTQTLIPTIFMAFADEESNNLPELKGELQGIEKEIKHLELYGDLHIEKQSSITTNVFFDLLDRYNNPVVQRQLTIFHFAGHANKQFIEVDDGWIKAADIERFFNYTSTVELVFLNACGTHPQTEHFHKAGVPAVIATTSAIGDKDAKNFAVWFYTSLLVNRQSLKQAFERAVAQLQTHKQTSFDRTETDRGIVFKHPKQETQSQWVLSTISPEHLDWHFPFRNPLTLDASLDIITNHPIWEQSLRQELLRGGVSVKNNSWDTFKHYGWLVEAFLLKMKSPAGQEPNLRRLSFMAEAYQASLRYLCYIQLAQVLQIQAENQTLKNEIAAFLQMKQTDYLTFDYLSLLRTATACLATQTTFVPEITAFVKKLTDKNSTLFNTALFLDSRRRQLIAQGITEDQHFATLLDEYLSALTYWLRQVSFLAQYRLVSIKDINLNYQLGTAKNFVHLYGELHGIYNETAVEDYTQFSRENEFTYSKSVLLLKGSHVETSLNQIAGSDTYLSLSPFLIDQSVFATKPTQTPEIYYFTGFDQVARCYNFAQYKNELAYNPSEILNANKYQVVKEQNINLPKYDELYMQLEKLFNPFFVS